MTRFFSGRTTSPIPGGDWDEKLEPMVKHVYRTARLFQCVSRAAYITRDTDPYRLPGMNVNYLMAFEDFKCLVTQSDPGGEYCAETPVPG